MSSSVLRDASNRGPSSSLSMGGGSDSFATPRKGGSGGAFQPYTPGGTRIKSSSSSSTPSSATPDQQIVMAEVERLRSELEEAYETLQARENDLQLSATIGKRLVEENQEMSARLAQADAEIATEAETLRQENHKLRLEIRQDASERAAAGDLEREVKQLTEQLEAARARGDRVQKQVDRAEREATRRAEERKEAAGRADLEQQQLRDKVARLERTIEELQSVQVPANYGQDAELEQLATQVNTLQVQLQEAQSAHAETQETLARERFEMDALMRRHEALTTRSHSLEETLAGRTGEVRDAVARVAELTHELEEARATTAGPMGAGLDLYSEIEEKRLALELALSALTAKHAALKRAFTNSEHRRRQDQQRIRMLMQMGGNKADTAKLQSMQRALSQKHDLVVELGNNVLRLERSLHETAERLRNHHAANTDFGDKQGYVDYLQQQEEALRDEIGELKTQVSTRVMTLMSESTKLRKSEAELYKSKRQCSLLQNEVMQLKMDLEEIKLVNQNNININSASDALTNAAAAANNTTASATTTTVTTTTHGKATGKFLPGSTTTTLAKPKTVGFAQPNGSSAATATTKNAGKIVPQPSTLLHTVSTTPLIASTTSTTTAATTTTMSSSSSSSSSSTNANRTTTNNNSTRARARPTRLTVVQPVATEVDGEGDCNQQ